MKKLLTIFFIIAFFGMLISPCYAQQSANRLIGKWIFPNVDEISLLIEFTNTEIIYKIDDQIVRGNYSINNNIIIMDNEPWMDFEIINNNILKLMEINDRENYLSGMRYITERVTSLNGKFVPIGYSEGIRSIEFIDNKYLRMNMIITENHYIYIGAEYELSNNKLIVKTGSYMFIFDVINNLILENGESIFIKK